MKKYWGVIWRGNGRWDLFVEQGNNRETFISMRRQEVSFITDVFEAEDDEKAKIRFKELIDIKVKEELEMKKKEEEAKMDYEAQERAKQMKISKWCVLGFLGFTAFLIFGLGTWFTVGVGEVGVVFNQMSGHTKVAEPGVHFKIPLIENVTRFDVKTLAIQIEEECGSKDLQVVRLKTVLNFHLEKAKVNDLYSNVGAEYQEKIMHPLTLEVAKATVAQYPVEGIILKREELKDAIEKSLRVRLAAYNIILESVSLVNVDFSVEFNKVVEQKQVAEQGIKVAENMRLQAEKYKQKTILEAEAASESQRLMKQNATAQIIALEWIKKWSGNVPTVVVSDKQGGGIFMQMPAIEEQKQK